MRHGSSKADRVKESCEGVTACDCLLRRCCRRGGAAAVPAEVARRAGDAGPLLLQERAAPQHWAPVFRAREQGDQPDLVGRRHRAGEVGGSAVEHAGRCLPACGGADQGTRDMPPHRRCAAATRRRSGTTSGSWGSWRTGRTGRRRCRRFVLGAGGSLLSQLADGCWGAAVAVWCVGLIGACGPLSPARCRRARRVTGAMPGRRAWRRASTAELRPGCRKGAEEERMRRFGEPGPPAVLAVPCATAVAS